MVRRSAGSRRLPFVQFALSPLLISFYMEYLATGIVFRAPYYMLVEYGLLLCAQMLLLALMRKSRRAQWTLAILCFALALISHMKMDFRGTPLLPWDIYAAGTAMAVASHYSIRFSVRILTALLMLLLVLLIARAHAFELPRSRRVALLRGLSAGLCVLVFVRFFTGPMILSDYDHERAAWSPSKIYERYGFGAGLFVNARLMVTNQPLYYNLLGLREAMLHAPQDPPEDGPPPAQNVIVIMNETFSDLGSVFPIDLSRDPMPFVRGLMGESVSGTLHVSVLGGGTSTSEFEMLTGNTSRFFPVESTPYVQYLDAEAQNGYSIASRLKAQGFRTVAIHPGEPDAWNRNGAYPILGIDTYYALPNMPDREDEAAYLRGYYRDEGVYAHIIEQREAKAPGEKLFILAVTIQNHGDYYAREPVSENPVTYAQDPEDARGSEYLSLVARSDAAFADFLGEVRTWEEPTAILFFGDHQPRLPSETYAAMTGGEDPFKWPEARRSRLYETPFLIWRNDGALPPEDLGDLSVNYLGGLLLEKAGYTGSDYMRYLAELRRQLPVITAHTILDAQGNHLTLRQARKRVPLLHMYQTAQYNLLFDRWHKQSALFE